MGVYSEKIIKKKNITYGEEQIQFSHKHLKKKNWRRQIIALIIRQRYIIYKKIEATKFIINLKRIIC